MSYKAYMDNLLVSILSLYFKNLQSWSAFSSSSSRGQILAPKFDTTSLWKYERPIFTVQLLSKFFPELVIEVNLYNKGY